MHRNVQNGLVAVAAVAAAALGGSAIAGAAGNGSSTGTSPTPAAKQGKPHMRGGRHVGANGVAEKALSSDVAAKVKAAALDKYPGATVERVETDADHGSPYEAHITTKDGKHLEVLVDQSYAVTASNEMGHP